MSQQPFPLPPYKKPWLSFRDQVSRLQSRGLIVSDVQAAMDFLRHVNYYRFSGFCLAFESSRHQFSDGVTFEQVRTAYQFDRVVRDIVTEALEVVELDFRTAVAHHFGQKYGAFGHKTIPTSSNVSCIAIGWKSYIRRPNGPANFLSHISREPTTSILTCLSGLLLRLCHSTLCRACVMAAPFNLCPKSVCSPCPVVGSDFLHQTPASTWEGMAATTYARQ